MLYKIHVLDINVASMLLCNSVMFAVLSMMTVKNIIFWDVMVCTASTFEVDSEDGGFKFFWNAIPFLPNYTASHSNDRSLDYVIPLSWGSSVCIFHHGLEDHGSVPSRGMCFSLCLQVLTDSEVHPVPCPIGHEDSFLRGKTAGEYEADHSSPPSAKFKIAFPIRLHDIKLNYAQWWLYISPVTSFLFIIT